MPSARGRKIWTSRLVRSHRHRPGPLGSTLSVLLAFGIICCVPSGIALTVRLGIRVLIHNVGYLPACGLTVLVFLLLGVGALLRVHTARRALALWSARTGWSPVVGRTVWPWTAQQTSSDAVTVHCAVGTITEGYPLIVGEVSWARNGLDGSVERSDGRGIFAIVRLPRPYPYVAVQRRRLVRRGRAGEDEFNVQFRILLEDLSLADRLAAPALREAHVTGRVPPWTIVGDELYAVIPTRRLLRPALAVDLSNRMLFLVRLIGIESDSLESTN